MLWKACTYLAQHEWTLNCTIYIITVIIAVTVLVIITNTLTTVTSIP